MLIIVMVKINAENVRSIVWNFTMFTKYTLICVTNIVSCFIHMVEGMMHANISDGED